MRASDMSMAAAGMHSGAKAPGKKPAKVLDKIEYHRAADGKHVFHHHHTAPEHHPMEEHSYSDHDKAVDHFIKHTVPANPGEEEKEPGAEAAEEAVGGGEEPEE